MKNYQLREPVPGFVNTELAGHSELMRTLLFYRGQDTKEKAEIFLNPNYERDIHDPFLLKDMEKAVERILKAIENSEKILIYSDYDADGIPAAVVLSDFFRLIGYENFEVYIPHRHTEGYGLHLEAVEIFKEKDIKLLITLDCGIVDHAEVARASELGIDVIITDHHTPGEKIPEAYAVVNAKRTDCEYPFDHLCGSGVAFKLVQALLTKLNKLEGKEKWLLDMVGLATLSDMVPLTGENRVFAYYGLKVLRKSRRPGLTKLLKIMNVDKQYLTEDDIGFMISPRINAASRMGVPIDAFNLLSTQDEDRADELAKHLDSINNERKGLVASTVKEIKKLMSGRAEYFQGRSVIVLGNPLWRPALLGLAANSVAEEFNKPVFLWGREGGTDIKGSCRSGGAVHLVRLMERAAPSFKEFGGHTHSGGFAVNAESVHTLDDALNSAFGSLGHADALEEPNYVDSKLFLEDINASLYYSLEKLAPFGMDNPKPVFLFENIMPADVRAFGKAKDHLELSFLTKANRKVRAIGFFMKAEDFGAQPKKDIPMSLVATIEKSYFGRAPELRLRIVDII